MTNDAELLDLLAMQLVPGLGARLTAALMERFGSATAVRQASVSQLTEVPYVSQALATRLKETFANADPRAELALMHKHGVTPLIRGKPDYPASLDGIHNPPYVLYVRGQLVPADIQAVAIVGSRRCTPYGKRVAEKLAGELVRAGYTVISGLARGIDGAAHRGALQAGGRTLAVLAGGLSRIYPPEHAELAEEIVNQGAVMAETTMAQEPLPNHFPARNRIISGLAQAVVLVEAAVKSGALITADHAAEQGRPVFAVPGPIDQEASSGTNALIRTGATLCRGVSDILEELQGLRRQPPASTKANADSAPSTTVPTPAPLPPLDPLQQRLWDLLASEAVHLDDLVSGLGLSVPKLSALLLGMEMKKLIRRLPGNRYSRNA